MHPRHQTIAFLTYFLYTLQTTEKMMLNSTRTKQSMMTDTLGMQVTGAKKLFKVTK